MITMPGTGDQDRVAHAARSGATLGLLSPGAKCVVGLSVDLHDRLADLSVL